MLLQESPRASMAAGEAALAAALKHPAQAATRLGSAFAAGTLSSAQRKVAIELFNAFARDTEVEVRRTLAEHIKSSPLLPRSLAMTLAQDVEVAALPVLEHSTVLTDGDLLTIIAGGSTPKQQAIARRGAISEPVSGALAGTGKKAVLTLLLDNGGACIADTAYGNVLDCFRDDPKLQALLVERPSLPLVVKERLICLISDELKGRLIERQGIPAELMELLSRQGRERALVDALSRTRHQHDAEGAATRLRLKNALTPSLLLRALAAGHLEFFGAAMASLARVPSANAQEALRKAGTPALQSLYERAGLPAQLQKAFQVVLEATLDARRLGEAETTPEQERFIIEGLVRAYRKISPDSLDSVIFQLSRLAPQD